MSRLATELKKIRKRDSNAILFNTGDTLEEGAEALYTSGQSMIDVLDTFNIDGGYTPGNWDFLYGKSRFLELFGAGRWNVVAANVYDADTGQRIVPPYRIIETQGIKIGVPTTPYPVSSREHRIISSRMLFAIKPAPTSA